MLKGPHKALSTAPWRSMRDRWSQEKGLANLPPGCLHPPSSQHCPSPAQPEARGKCEKYPLNESLTLPQSENWVVSLICWNASMSLVFSSSGGRSPLVGLSCPFIGRDGLWARTKTLSELSLSCTLAGINRNGLRIFFAFFPIDVSIWLL